MIQTTTMGFTGDFNWEEGMRAIKRERLDGGAGREGEREGEVCERSKDV